MEKQQLKGMIFAALFAALTGVVAWFKIPLQFTPVPITLQTLLVLMSGAMLGPAYGALAMIIYLILGAIGLPVFAGGSSGFGTLLGPSGGYLLSYPIAAFIIGKMLEKKKLSKFLKFISFILIIILVVLVALDAIFKIGIIKLGDKAMISLITEQQRASLIIISLGLLLLFSFIVFYAKKAKSFSLNVVLAMFAGTLIIYLLGAIH